MNDASSSSPPTNPEAHPTTDHEASTATATAAAEGSVNSSTVQRKSSAQKAQKLAFLDNLIRNLDIVVFCQLSILYYMDCSLFKFLLRALPHWFFFTPKPDILSPANTATPNNGPYIGAVVSTNFICILLHTMFAPPAAGEAARGYLHGGMIIDFVGQASPVGRWKLVGFDFLCLGLQIVMMALTMEKVGLQGRSARTGAELAAEIRRRYSLDVGGIPRGREQPQDLDAEERGVLGAEESEGLGIEMQDLGRGRARSRGRTGGEEDGERDELLTREEQGEDRREHPLDEFYAGDHMLVKLHLLETVRAQWRASRLRTETPGGGATTSATRGVQSATGRFVARRMTFTWGRRSLGGGGIA